MKILVDILPVFLFIYNGFFDSFDDQVIDLRVLKGYFQWFSIFS